MYFICNDCLKGLRVVDYGFPQLMTDSVKNTCYSCSSENIESGLHVDNAVLQQCSIRDITMMEFFLVQQGCGLPEERECASEIVNKLFEEKKVKSVVTEPVPNTGRCVLNAIVFEDDTVMYLGSSVHGALVYRIRKPHSYTEAALDSQP